MCFAPRLEDGWRGAGAATVGPSFMASVNLFDFAVMVATLIVVQVMQECMHESMQVCNFLSGLAPGIDLLSGLPADKGTCERDAVSQPCGADLNVQLCEGFGSLPGFVTLRRGRVEDGVDRLTGGLEELKRRGDGLDVEDGGPAGHEDDACGLGGVEGGPVGVRRGIENE